MRTLLNIIWLLLGGIWLALAYFIVGILSCIPIITIPVGLAAMRMAKLVLWPFGKKAVKKPGYGAGARILNLVWFVLIGWVLALLHVAAALAQTLTIVGIANAVVSIKLIPVSCFPFGKRIVSA
ncbi:YccF domain-containing protein [Tessaracoccus sp. OH4464_COT-324]|uniref:YccF domain-containing protein n=1 Tax=Tessaracoccus sp. OH4464_COT-324 TaxID=2491059 RepID=UPI000F6411B1|nr:YccF domain-containing protein [Tessaracoccus sp. OH4464_COT-324]RRD45975.1 YccF domain-containing protein [Tessaracoccus sp. OH4464_COT-324]